MLPEPGQIVRVRSRQYLVEGVQPPPTAGEDSLVRLSCLEDDAQGEPLAVLWEREIDTRILGGSAWESITKRGFDDPRMFASYLNTLRWSCVTSTDPKLFQAPYRAGIEVKAYQLEPLRKALLLPRVNLFIADDVGLGKTIEAGLILRELLQRQKVRRVVISCPPSVVLQWRDEMDARFGLSFVVYDRELVATKRRERGYGTNPWTTHSRFIVSHALLRDESHAAGLRDWLQSDPSGALLILDEAHNAAPSSGQRYAVDSQLTRTVRELAPLFEHKLFLSATPHNGHSNSFAALLEILDPQRFTRGVPVEPKQLEPVMVRRLKADLRDVDGGFPRRRVLPIVIDGLPASAPELRLSTLLQEYTRARDERLATAPKSVQNAAGLVMISLQKRLLSSIEAFACTLRAHRRAVDKHAQAAPEPDKLRLLRESPGNDDDHADLPEAVVTAEEEAQVEAASRSPSAPSTRELQLLDEMTAIAERERHMPDTRSSQLVDWIRANLLDGRAWRPRRVLIFTEYADTKRWLMTQLATALSHTERADDRVAAFHGGMDEHAREDVKEAFNADPDKHPLRVLVCTDAAREGLNLQNHCADLFHIDVPWNPSRMEQRNGRIDRKLQRSDEVRCHYFVLPQRAEDRVLQVLVEKTARIQRELGSLSPVIEKSLDRILRRGIRHTEAQRLATDIDSADQNETAARGRTVIDAELEAGRSRREHLAKNLVELRAMLDTSKTWLGLDERSFREALSASLELLGAPPLQPADAAEAAKDTATARWVFPPLDRRAGADPTWAATLDTLRPRRKRDQKPWDWRRESPILPILFNDAGRLDAEAVHVHLEHRVVQRLLGRFLAQGFVHDDLRRACVVLTDDPTPRVLVLGRLSLYGDRAARLHDEVLLAAAEWSDPDGRDGKLVALPADAKEQTLALLNTSLTTPRLRDVPKPVQERLARAAARDVEELRSVLQRRSAQREAVATRLLKERGERESRAMRDLLLTQKERIGATIQAHSEGRAAEHQADLEKQKAKVEKRIAHVEDQARQGALFGRSVDPTLDALRASLRATLAGVESELERKQVEADRRHWVARFAAIDEEIAREPERIKAAYEVRASRVEPVGVVYLWPVSG